MVVCMHGHAGVERDLYRTPDRFLFNLPHILSTSGWLYAKAKPSKSELRRWLQAWNLPAGLQGQVQVPNFQRDPTEALSSQGNGLEAPGEPKNTAEICLDLPGPYLPIVFLLYSGSFLLGVRIRVPRVGSLENDLHKLQAVDRTALRGNPGELPSTVSMVGPHQEWTQASL